MKINYGRRQKKTAGILSKKGITAAIIRDFEGSRNSSLRYLTGHPGDALLFIFGSGKTILLPWDVNLAARYAQCSKIIPYTDFDRDFTKAAAAVLKEESAEAVSRGFDRPRIDVSSSFTWPDVEMLKEKLPETEFLCSRSGIDSVISGQRAVKENTELRIIRKAAKITDRIIELIEKKLLSAAEGGRKVTETDIALLIEKSARRSGAEGTGFETIAASPSRSAEIHPHPYFTAADFSAPGLSVIDFGIKYLGYTTDVTIAIAAEPLSERQREMVSLVTEAAASAEKMLKPGTPVSAPADEVNRFFRSRGYAMPHALGHGTGLDVHEPPFLRPAPDTAAGAGHLPLLEKGLVLGVDPALSPRGGGGIRLENDYIITESGCEKITSSRVIHLRRC